MALQLVDEGQGGEEDGGGRRGLTPSLAARVKVLNNWLSPLLALLQVWEEEGQGGVKKGQDRS